jgi:hypothetical protein
MFNKDIKIIESLFGSEKAIEVKNKLNTNSTAILPMIENEDKSVDVVYNCQCPPTEENYKNADYISICESGMHKYEVDL